MDLFIGYYTRKNDLVRNYSMLLANLTETKLMNKNKKCDNFNGQIGSFYILVHCMQFCGEKTKEG